MNQPLTHATAAAEFAKAHTYEAVQATQTPLEKMGLHLIHDTDAWQDWLNILEDTRLQRMSELIKIKAN